MSWTFHEVFGYHASSSSPVAKKSRQRTDCPFKPVGFACYKGSKANPLGVCSIEISTGQTAVVCPVRFQQDDIVIRDAAREAFGHGATFYALPEFDLMQDVLTGKMVAKVDYLLVKVDANKAPLDFCLLEMQAVYISGKSYRPAFDSFLAKNIKPTISGRGADFRSSNVKRLVPQLSLKVPTVRSWAKKVIVAVDATFFASFQAPITCAAPNSEVTWLVYEMLASRDQDVLRLLDTVHTKLDESVRALNSVVDPLEADVVARATTRMAASGRKTARTVGPLTT